MKKTERKLEIALVNPPILKGVFRHQVYLPIGLAYIAAVLEKSGYKVTVMDCPVLEIDHEKLKGKIASLEPIAVGITSMTPIIQSALLSARVAKEAYPNAFVILGGPHATFMDKQILSEKAEVDVVVRGEGEQTMLELAHCITHSGDFHKVAGITFKKNEQIVRTPNRPFIQELDELPRPAYKYFPLEEYRIFGKKILPIMTSRGCPFQCSFCVTARMVGKEFRARSPKSVVDELEWLRDEYGADAFTFYDDTFTLDRQRVYEICDGIKKRKIDVPWDCETRVDQVSKEVLIKMKRANCQLITFGVESGCQQILDSIRKRTSVDQNKEAIKWAKEVGLSVVMSVIIGYPGETIDTLRQTLDFIRKAEPDDAYLCMATPYPGTDFYDLVKETGWKISKDWSHYNTITPVFENPLIPAEKMIEIRRTFYNNFYSPSYILRQLLKGNFYSRMLARIALNRLLWRIKPSRRGFS